MKKQSIRIWFFIVPLVLGGMNLAATAEALANPGLVVFLVRHAEKVDASRDPELSAAGKSRAKVLAHVLRDAKLEHIHSSDYARTLATAAPIAAQVKLAVKRYDARDLPSLVELLKQSGGRHLVVGHSTTTPKVVEMLGGSPGTEIDEAGEYDRLYVVTVGADGNVTTVLMRYGAPFPATNSD